jgi:putative ABC transport system permease protein
MWPDVPLSQAIGREIEINDHRAVIVGICDASVPYATFPVIYTKYSSAMYYVGQTRKRMSFILLLAREGEDHRGLSQRITRETGLKAMTWWEFSAATIIYYLLHTGIPINFGLTVLLGFMVGAAVVGQTFYMFVIENLRQFGALKAMGVGNSTILGMVLLQAALVVSVGYAIGIGLCAASFDVTSRLLMSMRGFFLPWQVMLVTAVAVIAIIAIASFASIRKVLVVDPAIVFRG